MNIKYIILTLFFSIKLFGVYPYVGRAILEKDQQEKIAAIALRALLYEKFDPTFFETPRSFFRHNDAMELVDVFGHICFHIMPLIENDFPINMRSKCYEILINHWKKIVEITDFDSDNLCLSRLGYSMPMDILVQIGSFSEFGLKMIEQIIQDNPKFFEYLVIYTQYCFMKAHELHMDSCFKNKYQVFFVKLNSELRKKLWEQCFLIDGYLQNQSVIRFLEHHDLFIEQGILLKHAFRFILNCRVDDIMDIHHRNGLCLMALERLNNYLSDYKILSDIRDETILNNFKNELNLSIKTILHDSSFDGKQILSEENEAKILNFIKNCFNQSKAKDNTLIIRFIKELLSNIIEDINYPNNKKDIMQWVSENPELTL